MINVGDKIDHFLIKEFKGAGHFSLVYVAHDTHLGRLVALKFANTSIANSSPDNPDHPEKGEESLPLLREARSMVDLHAPHTTRVLSIGKYKNEIYLVYEYMNQTLEQELVSHGSLGWQNCLRSFHRIAETIDHLHRRGYVHGDLRPRIIMYDDRGLCYVADMVIVRRAGMVKWQNALNLAVSKMDVFEYAPPEARLQPDEYVLDPSFDIWSIGLVMYEALTGQSLVKPLDELRQHGFDVNYPSPVSFDASIPHQFEEICRICLSVEPEDRYTSSQLLEAIQGISQSERPKKPKVFISHASKDREFVEDHIVRFLESNGVSTWYSKATIQSATEWERSILQGLRECSWFLLVMSTASCQSEWVKDEVFWGIDNRQDRIIPIIIDDVDVSDFHIRLRRIQAIDLREDPGVDNEQILELINRGNG